MKTYESQGKVLKLFLNISGAFQFVWFWGFFLGERRGEEILLLFESNKKLASYKYADNKLNDRQNDVVVRSQ